MLAKAFGVGRYMLWSPFTFLICTYFLDHACFCPECGSENVVRDGYGRRKTMPNIPMFECRECGRDFCLRANTIFYWKHASMGELFILPWIFFGKGSRDWSRIWVCDVGKYCALEWFKRLENSLLRFLGVGSAFLEGFFRADEMQIRSFGEKLLVFGVKREDGKISETPLKGESALEFKSALKNTEEELGPIVEILSHVILTSADRSGEFLLRKKLELIGENWNCDYMGMTASEKIIVNHTDKDSVSPGESVEVYTDSIFLHDASGMELKRYEELGIEKGVDPDRVHVYLGHHHCSPASREIAEVVETIREYAKKYSVEDVNELGTGLGHFRMIEDGNVWPGVLAQGGDSHTTAYGAVGAFSSRNGYEEALGFNPNKQWLRVPEAVKLYFDGELAEGSSPRDVATYLIRDLGMDIGISGGYIWRTLEYRGPWIQTLSVYERLIFSCWAWELNAENGIIEPNDEIEKYMRSRCDVDFDVVRSDPDANYVEEYEYDVSDVEPLVSAPGGPMNVKNIEEEVGREVDQVYIGGCTGAGIDGLKEAAEIMKNSEIDRTVRVMIVPATPEIYDLAVEKGLIKIFREAGATIFPPYCGPCQAMNIGVLAPDEVMIHTAPRNWPGRNESDEVYLGSPYTAAASALEGEITDPRELI